MHLSSLHYHNDFLVILPHNDMHENLKFKTYFKILHISQDKMYNLVFHVMQQFCYSVFSHMILFKGIVRMEVLDNLDFSSEDPRETGDTEQFNPGLIPFQRTSYLGQFLSQSVWASYILLHISYN